MSCAWIAYEAPDPQDPERDDAVALVRLDHVSYIVANGPNDEAFHNHRFYDLGLKFRDIQEVLNSPWIEEVLSMLHKDGVFTGAKGSRHFVFALKETTVDCLADSAHFVAFFRKHREAMAAALAEMSG